MKITRYRGGSSTGHRIHPLPWLLLFAGTVTAILLALTHGMKRESEAQRRPAPVPQQQTATVSDRKPAEQIEQSSAADAKPVGATPPESPPDILKQFNLDQRWKGDFDFMRKQRMIRALVVYSKTMYFLDGARQRGATYEFLKQFEDSINEKYRTGNLRIHLVFIPVHRDELLQGLVEGRGDIAAANLTITDERLKLVNFSEPMISNVNEVVVTGPSARGISSLEDLAGKEVYVRKSSSFYEHLKSLNESFHSKGLEEVRIRPADEYLESEDILEMVNAGLVPMTVVDSHVAEVWRQIYPEIRVRSDLVVHSGAQVAWAFRKNNPKLKKVADEFIRSHRTGSLFGNMLVKRYFNDASYIKDNTGGEDLKKYRSTIGYFKKYAGQYGFDYLMMAAQGYQESGLDQSRVSRSGAVGVMQVKPTTAADRNVNIPNIKKVDNNIHAGIKYMRFVMDYYFRREPMDAVNRNLFAVASYNAGPARIAQLRKLAAKMGLNPNVWFRNVEVVAASQIGRETVQYVSNIFKYYLAYKQIEAKQELKK